MIRWAAALSAAALGLAACADSLHIGGGGGKTTTTTSSTTGDGGGGGATTTSSSSATGGAPTGCKSNKDCGYPEPLCDTVQGACVECITVADCGVKAGTVCSFGSCVCPSEDGGPALTFCADSKGGHCADTLTSPDDCGGCGKQCFGSCATGACSDAWRPMTTAGAPSARAEHVGVWAASAGRLFVWGGKSGGTALDSGGLYDPVADKWKPTTPVNAPSPRWGATAVWDDQENVVIVWGGMGPAGQLKDGGMYDPAADKWTSIPGAILSGRSQHTAVWASFTTPFMGSSYGMMVWGGTSAGGVHFNDGALFDPAPGKGTWTLLEGGGPAPRSEHTAVWNSATNVMIIMGGFGGNAIPDDYLGDAWAFDPSKTGNSPWADLSSTVSPRARHTAVFGLPTPSTPFMVVFAGSNGVSQLPDGAIYRAGAWSPLDPLNFPEGREAHTAVWMDAPVSKMVILGGTQAGVTLGTAWALDVNGPSWKQLPSPPGVRSHHIAVTDGKGNMLAWGGDANGSPLDTGVIYTAP